MRTEKSRKLDAAAKAAARAREAAGARDEAIRAAAAATSVRKVAEVVDLSAARVHQIVHGR